MLWDSKQVSNQQIIESGFLEHCNENTKLGRRVVNEQCLPKMQDWEKTVIMLTIYCLWSVNLLFLS